MILSQSAIYAVRASLLLATADPSTRTRVDEIAEGLDVPRNYLSKILHVLARDGVLSSSTGPGGGFRLARPAAQVMLSDVVASFDPVHQSPGCLLGRRECSDGDPCAVHDRWKGIAAAVGNFLKETSLEELSRTRSYSGGTR